MGMKSGNAHIRHLRRRNNGQWLVKVSLKRCDNPSDTVKETAVKCQLRDLPTVLTRQHAVEDFTQGLRRQNRNILRRVK